ncbi:MAG: CofH family radical SAM protein [Bacteroides sp.]|nr:MAG: CofH family radical SAM protein [Bacteroides sp.]
MNKVDKILEKALSLQWINVQEAVYIFNNAHINDLMYVANHIRNIKKKNTKKVTWIIDRNINTTNVCIANCKFCNFFRIPNHKDSYITSIETYKKKIDETIAKGGNQLLLQGGHHPNLDINYYTNLFKEIKKMYPNIKLHALGPPEIVHISKISNLSIYKTLSLLIDSGLDSLPGAGAEILVDRVRNIIATGKCSTKEWLNVMKIAHELNITTSATMMFGHIETIEERFTHIDLLRKLQFNKPENSKGFIAFILWPFQDENTILKKVKNVKNNVTTEEYIKMLSISRIMLMNITNIQVSWLTVGYDIAKICLNGGANDMGSIMIEENVVSAAGAKYRLDKQSMESLIREAGFIPQMRNQEYEYIF